MDNEPDRNTGSYPRDLIFARAMVHTASAKLKAIALPPNRLIMKLAAGLKK